MSTRRTPSMHIGRNVIFAGLLLPALIAPGVSLGDTDTAETELRDLRERIDSLQKNMAQTREERDAARAALRPLGQQINRQARQLHKTRMALRAAGKELKKLESERYAARHQLSRQRTALSSHARAAYALGNQDYLKLLLNQQHPATFGRMMTYYRYFTEARARRIDSLKQDLSQLTRLESRIQQRTRALEQIETRRQNESVELERSRRTRATLLASLNRDLRSREQQISSLKKDESQLQALLNRLPGIAPNRASAGGFRAHRGRLPLPVRGRVSQRYGTPRAIGDLKWKGIFIAADSGQEVKAVYDGRVVFADWLPGYGLLLILEHGDGYMTLYGNNESLYPQLNDRIEAGQVIAITGNTGNIAGTGLYFELRHQGQPHDPLRWCRRG